MRPTLLIACLFALLWASTARGQQEGSTTHTLPQQSDDFKRRRAEEAAAIKAYCEETEEYFKFNPQLTRHFVNASPEGKAGWHELNSADEMLEAARSYATMTIAVSTRSSGEIGYAEVAETMKRSKHSNRYCFRNDGTLARVASVYDSERTNISLHRQRVYDSNVNLMRTVFQCFLVNPSTGERNSVSCERPEMMKALDRNEIKIYRKNSDLPVYALLKKP